MIDKKECLMYSLIRNQRIKKCITKFQSLRFANLKLLSYNSSFEFQLIIITVIKNVQAICNTCITKSSINRLQGGFYNDNFSNNL